MFSERAIAAVESCTTRVQSWFLDLGLVMGYWGGGRKRAWARHQIGCTRR